MKNNIMEGSDRFFKRLAAIEAWTKRGWGKGIFCLTRDSRHEPFVITDLAPDEVVKKAGDGAYLARERVDGDKWCYWIGYAKNGVKYVSVPMYRVEYEWPTNNE